jgi:hypothetical protein
VKIKIAASRSSSTRRQGTNNGTGGLTRRSDAGLPPDVTPDWKACARAPKTLALCAPTATRIVLVHFVFPPIFARFRLETRSRLAAIGPKADVHYFARRRAAAMRKRASAKREITRRLVASRLFQLDDQIDRGDPGTLGWRDPELRCANGGRAGNCGALGD